jgi:hypothetical protein
MCSENRVYIGSVQKFLPCVNRNELRLGAFVIDMVAEITDKAFSEERASESR